MLGALGTRQLACRVNITGTDFDESDFHSLLLALLLHTCAITVSLHGCGCGAPAWQRYKALTILQHHLSRGGSAACYADDMAVAEDAGAAGHGDVTLQLMHKDKADFAQWLLDAWLVPASVRNIGADWSCCVQAPAACIRT
jgi:hypothetical protein